MAAPVAAYLIAIGTMLFAGLVALTVVTVVEHLDPPERAAATPVREPDQIAVAVIWPADATAATSTGPAEASAR